MSGDKTWVTYRPADGVPIFGEYSWVDGLEWFDDLDEPLELVKETWRLVSSETLTVGPVDVNDESDDTLSGLIVY